MKRKIAIWLIAIILGVGGLLYFFQPPNHLARLQHNAIQEQTEYISSGGSSLIRVHTLYLHDIQPAQVEGMIRDECPEEGGWSWSGMMQLRSARKGDTTVSFGPTSVDSNGTGEAPEKASYEAIEFITLSKPQELWERLRHAGTFSAE